MSGSDNSNTGVAGAATTGTGAAIVASDGGSSWVSILGWAALIIGALVLTSFLIAFWLKRKNRNNEDEE